MQRYDFAYRTGNERMTGMDQHAIKKRLIGRARKGVGQQMAHDGQSRVIAWLVASGKGCQMSFQAKVRETGQLFVATHEVDKAGVWSKDANKLEKGKSYVGYLFSAGGSAPNVALDKPKVGILESDTLEELSVRIKLVVS
jgi:hypothetical protein